ncbi:MAG: Mut7-C RNAse domain-containing protein [Desulfurococcaceae archaeon]
MSSGPKFVVDTMLGSLARWLRILGYDTLYEREIEDWQILRRAELESRVIITRDRGLHNKAIKHGLRSILIWEEDMSDRLAHIAVIAGIKLSVDLKRTRCPEDNTLLVKVEKEKVKDRVPEAVHRFHSDFWECPRCGKVYWIGSHWKMIEEALARARIKQEELRIKMM